MFRVNEPAVNFAGVCVCVCLCVLIPFTRKKGWEQQKWIVIPSCHPNLLPASWKNSWYGKLIIRNAVFAHHYHTNSWVVFGVGNVEKIHPDHQLILEASTNRVSIFLFSGRLNWTPNKPWVFVFKKLPSDKKLEAFVKLHHWITSIVGERHIQTCVSELSISPI